GGRDLYRATDEINCGVAGREASGLGHVAAKALRCEQVPDHLRLGVSGGNVRVGGLAERRWTDVRRLCDPHRRHRLVLGSCSCQCDHDERGHYHRYQEQPESSKGRFQQFARYQWNRLRSVRLVLLPWTERVEHRLSRGVRKQKLTAHCPGRQLLAARGNARLLPCNLIYEVLDGP